MTDASADVLIIGAGHAGGTAAALLRQNGFEGSIILVGDEPIGPYQRPPLSKAALRDDLSVVPTPLKPVEFYAKAAIDLRLARRAERLDRQATKVLLTSGESISYDQLIIALGSRPVQLSVPGADLAGIVGLRTAVDAEQLRVALARGKHLAIVGGGYIGLEVAASARALGAEVTVIERESRLLARVASREISSFFHDCHVRHGVRFELCTAVTGFEGRDGRLTGICLGDGRTLDCDAALVGVGAVPNDEIAREGGLETETGIIVDHESRSSDPAIFAIGDVARRPVPNLLQKVRLESVPNALEQARQAAAAITGRPAPKQEIPWQWSDQYDLKLQMAGIKNDCDRTVLRGAPSSQRFCIFHLKEDRLHCVEAINSPQEFALGKQFIAAGARIDVERLGNPAVPLNDAIA